jgi:hypothetical protein
MYPRAQGPNLQEKTKDQMEDTAEDVKRTGQGIMSELIAAQRSLDRSGVSMPAVVGTCLLTGLTFGTVFQVTHNNGYLPVRLPVWKHKASSLGTATAVVTYAIL